MKRDVIILEVDYSGLEVRVIAMASKCPELSRQVITGVDLHRRWAAEIYQKAENLIDKQMRYEGKNQFVFPCFYGSLKESIARSFPTISKDHIFSVFDKFWIEFAGVKSWQNETIEIYKNYGYVEGLTGFRRPGPLTVNQLFNTPIQGTAFHLLLDGLYSIDKEMAARKMKSTARIEVHDSITFFAYIDEVEEIVSLVTKILCSKRFDWQGDIPLDVEWEISKKDWYGLKSLGKDLLVDLKGVKIPWREFIFSN